MQQARQGGRHLPAERAARLCDAVEDAAEAEDEPEDVRENRHADGPRGGAVGQEALPDQHAAAQDHPHAQRVLLHGGVLESRKESV